MIPSAQTGYSLHFAVPSNEMTIGPASAVTVHVFQNDKSGNNEICMRTIPIRALLLAPMIRDTAIWPQVRLDHKWEIRFGYVFGGKEN